MSRAYNDWLASQDGAPDSAEDDGFHDHALQELYRAAEDLAGIGYTAANIADLIAAHFVRLVAARSAVPSGPDPWPIDGEAA